MTITTMTLKERITHKIFCVRAKLFGQRIEVHGKLVGYKYKDRFVIKSLKFTKND